MVRDVVLGGEGVNEVHLGDNQESNFSNFVSLLQKWKNRGSVPVKLQNTVYKGNFENGKKRKKK